METEFKSFPIIDYADDPNYKKTETPPPLPDSQGYELDTIEKARTWLTNPNNWFRSKLFILKWEGLIPRVSEEHGRRLIEEPWDDGLPWAAMHGQAQRRAKRDRGEELDQKEVVTEDE